jgi:hypothetical protein
MLASPSTRTCSISCSNVAEKLRPLFRSTDSGCSTMVFSRVLASAQPGCAVICRNSSVVGARTIRGAVDLCGGNRFCASFHVR